MSAPGMPTRGATGRTISHIALCFAALLVLLPFAWLICASLKSASDFFTSPFLPRGEGLLGVAWEKLTLTNFATLFTTAGFARGVVNSLFISSVSALGATLVCSMAGYALARLEFAGRSFVTWLVLVALIIPPPLLIAPGFRVLFELGLLDSFAGLIIPALAPAFGVYLFRQAVISSVPRELIDAARSDGCGEIRTFRYRAAAGSSDDIGVSAHHVPWRVEQLSDAAGGDAVGREVPVVRDDFAIEERLLPRLRFADGRDVGVHRTRSMFVSVSPT